MRGPLFHALRRVTDPSLADAILGDLDEERRRRTHQSRLGATLWFWRSSLAIVGYVTLQHVLHLIRTVAITGWGSIPGGRDLRYAARSLRRAPWYAVTAISVIALTMALAATAFAIVDGVLFKPLPYARPHELYDVSGGYSDALLAQKGSTVLNRFGLGISVRDARDLAAAVPGTQLSLYAMDRPDSQVGDLRTWVPVAATVDAQFFDVLGVHPLVGGFAPADFETPPGATIPAIVTYGTWQAQLGGRLDLLDRTLSPGATSTVRYRVVGVMPPGFVFPTNVAQPNLLAPLGMTPAVRDDRHLRDFKAIVRLPSDVPVADCQATFNEVARAGRAEIPNPLLNGGMGPWDVWALRPFSTFLGTPQRPTFGIVFAAALALVVLGCVNVSGLVASRSLDRARELSVRRALGARPRDVALLVFAESGVLIAIGSALGLAASQPMLALMLRLLPPGLGLLKMPALDARVMAFGVIASAASIGLVSIWPLRQSLRPALTGVLAEGGQGSTASRSIGRFLVVSVQVALGLILTLAGALIVGSLVEVWHTDLGYSTQDLVVISGSVTAGSTPAEQASALGAFLGRMRALPGVAAAGATNALFVGGFPGGMCRANSYGVTQGFFGALPLAILAGRVPTDAELNAGLPVVAISDTVARAYFPGQPAVGRQLDTPDHHQTFTVVGVVGDARYGAWDASPLRGQVYLAMPGGATFTLLVRTQGSAAAVLQEVLRAADERTSVRVASAALADDLLVDSIRPRRFRSWLFGSFAVAALAIVGVGVLGLIAMTTSRRRREVGIRVALGSTQEAIVRLLLREQLVPVVVGLVAGGLVSVWAGQLVTAYLYQLTLYDARAWAAAMAAVASVATLGVLVPAIRTSRIDPVKALRVD
jgi:putative ABC transport system permease protein